MANEEKMTENAVSKAMKPSLATLNRIESGIAKLGAAAAGGAEARVEEARAKKKSDDREEKANTLLEAMVKGISNLSKSMASKAAAGAIKGIGISLATVTAPIVMMASFFKQLKMEFAVLKSLTGGGLKKLFAPLKNLLTGEGKIAKAIKGALKFVDKMHGGIFTKIGNFFKGFKNNKTIIKISETITKTKESFAKGIAKLKKLFEPISKFFKGVIKSGKTATRFSKIATKILSFAKGFGSVLGKLFLPITIVMSAFDFITGFMKGYKEDGIMKGLEEGTSKLLQGLIGMPLDLLTKGVAWIAEKFGFDQVSQSLTAFTEGGGFTGLIEKMTKGFFDTVDGVIGWIKDLFTDPKKVLQELWDKTLDKAKSIGGWIGNKVLTPITKFFVDTFTWTKETFTGPSVKDRAEEMWGKVKKWFGEIFTFEWPKFKMPNVGDMLKGMVPGKNNVVAWKFLPDALYDMVYGGKPKEETDSSTTPTPTQAAPIKRQSAVVSQKRVVAVPNTARRIPQELGAGLNVPKSGIDWDFISKKEGGSLTDGYVPNPEGSKSGVTIATGFDLGARNAKSLEKSPMKDLPISLKTRLAPYMGLQGMTAKLFLDKNPLVISKSEAKLIDQMSKGQALKRLKKEWNYNAQFMKNGKKFDELSSAQQTVAASVAFQYGSLKKAPKFRNAAQSGNWDGAIGELRNFGDAYDSRRQSEADYLVAHKMNNSGGVLNNLYASNANAGQGGGGGSINVNKTNNNSSSSTVVAEAPRARKNLPLGQS